MSLAPYALKILEALEKAPVLDTMAKELLGINAPKILLTRTPAERNDVAISEIGNTLAFSAGGFGTHLLLNRIFKALPQQRLNPWAIIGRSLSFYSIIGSLMWAMPFVRNYLTTQKTGHLSYKDLITNRLGHHPHPSPRSASLTEQRLNQYQRQILSIVGFGLSGLALAAGTCKLAMSKKWGVKQASQWVHSKAGQALLLQNGQFSRFSGWPALLFWGAPAYGGWIHASRDPYEKKEQWLKFINFVGCFFVPGLLIPRHFTQKLQQLKLPTVQGQPIALKLTSIRQALAYAKQNGLPHLLAPLQQAQALWAKSASLSLGTSIALLGVMPQLLNIYLTAHRIAQSAPTPHFSPKPINPSGFRQAQPGSTQHKYANPATRVLQPPFPNTATDATTSPGLWIPGAIAAPFNSATNQSSPIATPSFSLNSSVLTSRLTQMTSTWPAPSSW